MSWRWICGGLLCACAAGCGGSDDRANAARYLPGWPEARAALEAALADWRDSSPPASPSRPLKGVQFVDKRRQPGDRLRSFSIRGEREVENAHQFTVRLQFEGEEGPRLVRYNVLGRDPIWVFRLEDYEMISHWEHPMIGEAEAPTESTPATGDSRRRPPAEAGSPGSSNGPPPPEDGAARSSGPPHLISPTE